MSGLKAVAQRRATSSEHLSRQCNAHNNAAQAEINFQRTLILWEIPDAVFI